MSRPRWNKEETAALAEIRDTLRDELDSVEQNIEVVGDRSLIRFYRGHLGVMPTVCQMISNYLKWRKENGVDEIRRNIVHNGINCPSKFPNGEKILDAIPQMVCDPTALDNQGVPISYLCTDFSVSKFFDNVTTDEYRLFIMYALELQNVVLEQLGNAEERRKLEEDPDSAEPYGVVKQSINIRNLSGLGMEHIGFKGQEIAKIMTVIARDNYPEMLRKMIVVNSPWIFNGFYWVIKALLPQRTIDKVSINGSNFEGELTKEVDLSSVPESLGGTLMGNGNSVPFEFDTTEGGLLWYSS